MKKDLVQTVEMQTADSFPQLSLRSEISGHTPACRHLTWCHAGRTYLVCCSKDRLYAVFGYLTVSRTM